MDSICNHGDLDNVFQCLWANPIPWINTLDNMQNKRLIQCSVLWIKVSNRNDLISFQLQRYKLIFIIFRQSVIIQDFFFSVPMFNTEIKKMAQGLFPSCLFNLQACPMNSRQRFPIINANVSALNKDFLGHFKINGTKSFDTKCKDQPPKNFHKFQVTENVNDIILDGYVFVYVITIYMIVFLLKVSYYLFYKQNKSNIFQHSSGNENIVRMSLEASIDQRRVEDSCFYSNV